MSKNGKAVPTSDEGEAGKQVKNEPTTNKYPTSKHTDVLSMDTHSLFKTLLSYDLQQELL